MVTGIGNSKLWYGMYTGGLQINCRRPYIFISLDIGVSHLFREILIFCMWQRKGTCMQRTVWQHAGAKIVACVQMRKFAGSEEWVLIWENTQDIYRDNIQVVSLGDGSLRVDKGWRWRVCVKATPLFHHTSILKLALLWRFSLSSLAGAWSPSRAQ